MILTTTTQFLLAVPALLGLAAYVIFATEHFEKRKTFLPFAIAGFRKHATWRQRTVLGLLTAAVAIALYVRLVVVGL